MPTGNELLNKFETKLDAEGSFLLPPIGETTVLNGRAWVRETKESLDGTHTLEWCGVVYWDDVKTNVVKQFFYVIDRNSPNEAAYWHQRNNPKPDVPPATFQQELTEWLDTKIEDGTILFYNVVGTLENKERAVVEVRMESADGLVRREVGVWRDTNGDFQYELITE